MKIRVKMTLESNLNGLIYQKYWIFKNKVSRDAEKGFIWILSTCVLLIPDYNFKLINYE